MSNYKIIFTGPVGAGKTTAISVMSDTPPVRTDEVASDMTTARKPTTTVALDYGTMRLDGGDCVHLYGTPGQERFDFMWEVLTQGAIGVVLLLDNTRPDPFADMRFFVNTFAKLVDIECLAIGVTRCDLKREPTQAQYAECARELGINPPIFEVDARSRRDVSILLRALLHSIDPELQSAAGQGHDTRVLP